MWGNMTSPLTTLKVLKNGYEKNLLFPAHEGDVGFDLVAGNPPEYVNNPETGVLEYVEYDTGVVIEPPKGFFSLLFPRSSISKTDLFLANGVGVVDEGYRGPIKVRFRVVRGNSFNFGLSLTKGGSDIRTYAVGSKIAQLVLMPAFTFPIQVTDSLVGSSRGAGGFGSTDAK